MPGNQIFPQANNRQSRRAKPEHFFNGQSLSGTFSVEDIMVSELDIAAPEAKIDIAFTEDKKNLKIYSHDVKLSKSGGLIKNLKVDGNFNKFNELQKLYVTFLDAEPFSNAPRFPEVLAVATKSGDAIYQVRIEGGVDKFELMVRMIFWGYYPMANLW